MNEDGLGVLASFDTLARFMLGHIPLDNLRSFHSGE